MIKITLIPTFILYLPERLFSLQDGEAGKALVSIYACCLRRTELIPDKQQSP